MIHLTGHLGESHPLTVVVDGEEMEVFGVEHLILLRKDENDAPEVRDKPCVD